MIADTARAQQAFPEAPLDSARLALNEGLVVLAERVLERALTQQARPPMGMYAPPSSVDNSAFDRAVHELCGEAHRLGLRAEELLVAIKKAWARLTQIRAHHLGDRDGDVLRKVVTSSIEVFFAARDQRVTDGARDS